MLSNRHKALLKQTGLDCADVVVPELYANETEVQKFAVTLTKS